MPFDFSKKAETGAWKNNCSFNCLTHFLCHELERESDSSLSKLYSEKGYKDFLTAFGQFYGVTPVTYHFLKHLVNKYQNPIDRETIFGSVLRTLLSDLLINNSNFRDIKFNEFLGDVSNINFNEFLGDVRINNKNSYVIKANADWFKKNEKTLQDLAKSNPKALEEKLRKFYSEEGGYKKAMEYLGGANYIIKANVEWFKKNEKTLQDLAKSNPKALEKELRKFYFEEGGYKKAMEYLGNANNELTISPEELAILTTSLSIPLEVYTYQDTERPFLYLLDKPGVNKNRKLTVINGGVHWEYEAQATENLKAHNRPYEIRKKLNIKIADENSTQNDYFPLAEEIGARFWTFMPVVEPKRDQERLEADIRNTVMDEFRKFRPPAEVKTEKKEDKKEHKKDEVKRDNVSFMAELSNRLSLGKGAQLKPTQAQESKREEKEEKKAEDKPHKSGVQGLIGRFETKTKSENQGGSIATKKPEGGGPAPKKPSR